MLRYFLIPVLLLAACLAAAPAYAGCSNPTGNEADKSNKTYHTLQFCNGTNWVPFGVYNPYVGPGDIVSGATAWYGLRAYNLAYTTGTNKAINIRRASDNTTMDIVILTSGDLDTATARASVPPQRAMSRNPMIRLEMEIMPFNQLPKSATACAVVFKFFALFYLANGSQYLVTGATPTISQPLTLSAVFEAHCCHIL